MDWKAFFDNDKFAADSGVVLTSVAPGSAVATLKAQARHLNAGGVVQGGAIFTLADLAMAAAVNAHGRIAFTIQSDIRFLESAQQDDLLTATAHQVLLKHTVAHYRVEIRNQQQTLIAICDGICHRKE